MADRRDAAQDRLPAVIGEGGEILRPEETVRHLAQRSRDHMRSLAFLQDAIAEAEDELLTERNTFEVGGAEEPNAGGYQDLARAFQIETKPVDVQVTWEPNTVWLEHGDQAAEDPAVAPVAEHCRALVTMRATAPWGQVIERQRSCSTRDAVFRDKHGNFRQDAYMDAEHVCVGRAETRAANAAVKAILGLQREEGRDATAAAKAEGRRQDKRSENRMRAVRKRWKRLLREHRISAETERNLATMAEGLPDDPDDWDDADYYEHALEMVERYGTRIFDRADKRAAEREEQDEEEADIERAEEEAATGEETDLACGDSGCDGVLKPGMAACPECGWLRDGPPPEGDRGEKDAEEASGADPDPETASEETRDGGAGAPAAGDDAGDDDGGMSTDEANAFERDLEERPLPEEGDEPPPGPEGPAGGEGPLARRSRLISEIVTRAKELGEDRTYPAEVYARVYEHDPTEKDLDAATDDELEVILKVLEEEIADVGNGGGA